MPDAKTMEQALPLFRRPFSVAAVQFKVQVNPKERDGKYTKALCVCFIDSRLVAERLNDVCRQWEDEYSPVFDVPGGHGVVNRLTVLGETREDVGWESSERMQKEGDRALKGLYSDAFKRAAVKFGIGAFLYATPKFYIDAGLLKNIGGKWYMGVDAEKELRSKYAAFLGLQATKDRFGEVLDHGDILDAQGDVETVSGELVDEPTTSIQTTEVQPQAASSNWDKDVALRDLKKLYADSKCTKAVWQAKLTQMGLSNVTQANQQQVEELYAFLSE